MESQEVTIMLDRISAGDKRAIDELFPLIYDELRRRARGQMTQEKSSHTLQATALVHEAYLKMVGREPVAWEGRGHFYNAAAKAMRLILIDHHRRRGSGKRGGSMKRVDIADVDVADMNQEMDWSALDEAMKKLEAKDERRHQVVMYHFFSGLQYQQIAEIMGCSEKTVQRDWETAKLFLLKELKSAAETDAGKG